jgi:hypothetical protein
VIVGDSVVTATSNQEIVLNITDSSVMKVVSSDEVLSYLNNDFNNGRVGRRKRGTLPRRKKGRLIPEVRNLPCLTDLLSEYVPLGNIYYGQAYFSDNRTSYTFNLS